MSRRLSFLLVLVPLAYACLPAALAAERPPAGAMVAAQALKDPSRWPTEVQPDPRAELLVPVNFVRIHSDEHSADQIAPRRWIVAVLEVANRVYRLSDEDMAAFGRDRPAPCIQFRINGVHDVHEREVSETLGYDFDTENVYGGGGARNGERRVGTRDLRTLKVTDSIAFLTVYCVWAVKDPDDGAQEFGGESNVGFSDRPPAGPRRVLTKVTSVQARIGVVAARHQTTFMSVLAHEFGHFFGLSHAWMREENERMGIRDLGTGPMRQVDTDPGYGNVMDYDDGPDVRVYFARSQLHAMYIFARDRASTQIQVIRSTGADAAPPPPPVAARPEAKFERVWTDAPSPGAEVVVHATIAVDNAKGRPGTVVAWFQDRTGQALRDADGRFRSDGGQVAVGQEITPKYDSARFGDVRLVLPAGQLHLVPGRYDLQVAAAFFQGGSMLADAAPVSFSYEEPRAPDAPGTEAPAGWFLDVKVVPTTASDGEPRVRILADIMLDDLLGQDVRLQARFSFTDGTPLRDFDGRYRSPEGLAMAESRVVPKYQRTKVTDMEVRIPVSQLHLADGSFSLFAAMSIIAGGRTLASANSHGFSLGAGVPPAPIIPMATFENVWVTHNHTFMGEAGLVVHARLTIGACPNRPVTIAAWFWGTAGQPLMDFDNLFRAANGQVSAWVTPTPLYPVATFPDLQVFLPYHQLHLIPGTHDLSVSLSAHLEGRAIGGHPARTPFRVVRR
ncbi:MAG: hypothetical protein JXP34_05650 [Planctomycetes bacterium]|nr:hypothetical protein [Planctomycetota bacterium]